ncbi:MAG: 2-aminoethylphosphonate--pyruvate transaminase [Balneolaceae bacterium]
MDKLSRKILLNPGPGTTADSVKKALVVDDICPREAEFGDLLGEIVDGLLQIGNGTGEYEACLFAASGTGAVEAMLTSALGENSKVLIITNGSYGFRMADICKSYGLNYETTGTFGEYPQISEIKKQLQNGGFTHLAMIHHETSTGMMNPLEEFAGLCEELDVDLIVDAMSSYGGYPINLKETKVSYLAASSNKCIHGMAGLSFVIFHKDCLEQLQGNRSNFYFDMYKQWSYLKEKNQLRFTPPVQICYAFRQAIKETLAETVEARWQRYQANWQVLYDAVAELGFEFFLPLEQQSKILMAIKPEGQLTAGFDHFHDYLFERNITVYPGVIPETKTFRMAVIGDLHQKDMEYVVRVMRDYMNR